MIGSASRPRRRTSRCLWRCRFHLPATLAIMACLLVSARASAQVNIAGYNITASRQERLGEKHGLLVGAVELERGDTKVYADEIEFFEDQSLAVARGNVVFTQGNNRIAADSDRKSTRLNSSHG